MSVDEAETPAEPSDAADRTAGAEAPDAASPAPEPPGEDAAVGAAETDSRDAEIERLKAEASEIRDRMLRVAADADNLRKRVQREIAEVRKYAAEGAIREVLPLADNVERAVAAARSSEAGSLPPAVASLVQGIELSLREFHAALSRLGVAEIEAAGIAFDPNRHEAVGFVETSDVQEDVIVDVFQRGFALHDRVLRPAMVRVARAPASAPPSPAPESSPEGP